MQALLTCDNSFFFFRVLKKRFTSKIKLFVIYGKVSFVSNLFGSPFTPSLSRNEGPTKKKSENYKPSNEVKKMTASATDSASFPHFLCPKSATRHFVP